MMYISQVINCFLYCFFIKS